MRVAYLLGIVHEVCLASPQVYLGIRILLCSLGVGVVFSVCFVFWCFLLGQESYCFCQLLQDKEEQDCDVVESHLEDQGCDNVFDCSVSLVIRYL